MTADRPHPNCRKKILSFGVSLLDETNTLAAGRPACNNESITLAAGRPACNNESITLAAGRHTQE